MKLRSILYALAAAFLVLSCIPKEDVKPEIIVPSESQDIFVSGMTFDSGEQSQDLSKTVTFTATDRWSLTITETTKALSWLSILPLGGEAGKVTLTVRVQPNTGTSPRGATVTITCGTYSVSFTVTQAGITPTVIPVASVTLNKTELTLDAGSSETLVATVAPDNATDKTVTWTSSAASVATVDQTGKVIAVGAGSATITAKAGDKTATCAVTVNAPVIEVTAITLDRTSATIEEGQTLTLVATVSPDNATDKTVTWTSSDTDIIVVDAGGTVTAVQEGTAAVTALAGSKVATCVVTVTKQYIEVTSVTLDKGTLSLEKGDAETLVATVAPDDATDKTVTWTSSDTSVATVDQNGRVTAVGGGSATITAKAGDKTATCAVTVTVPVESVTLDKMTAALEEGQTTTLTATVAPDDATDKTVTWSSSNTAVATVANGLVTAVSEGTATITATAGGKSASCAVTVSKQVIPVTAVTLNKTTLSLTKGSSETLVATVAPDNATDKSVTWSSSDVQVASVDQTGKVTAVGGGSATITAKAGEKTATCSVSVIVPVQSVTLDQTTLSLTKGGNATLVATVAPDDATDKTVTWITSNDNVATVDENGKVTAVGAGSAIITAKAGDKEATCTVSVTVPVTGVTLDQTAITLELGQTATLTATVSPGDATDKTVTWSTSDAAVATVSNGVVRALANGTATITAKAGGKTATCTVTVVTYTFGITPASVDISGDGDTFTITVVSTEGYSITSKPDWIVQQSVADKVHTFKAERNPGDAARSGAITFVDVRGTTLTCTVNQGQHSPDSADGDNEHIGNGDDINW